MLVEGSGKWGGFSSRAALSRRFGVDSRLPVHSRTEPWALAWGSKR